MNHLKFGLVLIYLSFCVFGQDNANEEEQRKRTKENPNFSIQAPIT